jgi:hypothetical protein
VSLSHESGSRSRAIRLGRQAGRRPLLVGLTMVGIGVLLSAIAIRLGG